VVAVAPVPCDAQFQVYCPLATSQPGPSPRHRRPATGGWGTYQSVHATVTLPGGDQLVTVFCETGGFNLDYSAWPPDQRGSAAGTESWCRPRLRSVADHR